MAAMFSSELHSFGAFILSVGSPAGLRLPAMAVGGRPIAVRGTRESVRARTPPCAEDLVRAPRSTHGKVRCAEKKACEPLPATIPRTDFPRTEASVRGNSVRESTSLGLTAVSRRPPTSASLLLWLLWVGRSAKNRQSKQALIHRACLSVPNLPHLTVSRWVGTAGLHREAHIPLPSLGNAKTEIAAAETPRGVGMPAKPHVSH